MIEVSFKDSKAANSYQERINVTPNTVCTLKRLKEGSKIDG